MGLVEIAGIMFTPKFFPSLLFGVVFFVALTPTRAQDHGHCQSSPDSFVRHGLDQDNLSICLRDQRQLLFCDREPSERGVVCTRPGLSQQLRALTARSRTWSSQESALLSTYAAGLASDQLKVNRGFEIQTGRFGHLSLDPHHKASCWKAILKSAYKLSQSFPTVTFVLSDRIKNCKALEKGTDLMIRRKERVLKNLASFSTPLHSVFLTDESKFNHYLMGHMGLYVNVNRRGEIAKRLIDFRIGRDQIPHETSNGRIGGLSQ
ncbi:MAG: hypothetical protein IT288_15990 [Bdellovibrionales bacterium]|nr:hypothetical protein [Bdellovibrionales bacterium]